MSKIIDHSIYCHANGIYLRCPPVKPIIYSLAQLIAQKVSDIESSLSYYIEVPACCNYFEESSSSKGNFPPEDLISDPWFVWNEFQTVIPVNSKVSLSLELMPDLPSEEEQKRWTGEPVTFIRLPSRVFVQTKKCKAAIPPAHQKFLTYLRKNRDITFVYDGPETGGHSLKDIAHYCKATLTRIINLGDPVSELWRSTFDKLQNPLQPLRDNLQSGTYEMFEKDPVKYEYYYRAIYDAIYDKIHGINSGGEDIEMTTSSPGKGEKEKKTSDTWKAKSVDEEKAKNTNLTILVVGAGRGPLVTSSLKAAREAKLTSVTIHIVEKNPHAILTLKSKMETVWPIQFPNLGKLFLHHVDMRQFNPSEKADIVVSELLGSFSDNELSPECLDGVYNAVKDDAICIPQSYTSHLHPIMSSKLYVGVYGLAESSKIPIDTLLQSHFVVNIRNFYSPCDTKEVFTFSHLNPSVRKESEKNFHNKKFIQLKFDNQLDYYCHGFAGYFTTQLYDSVKLSIRPNDYTKELSSWFPVYFPIVKPFLVRANEGITVNMWRQTDGRIVWYELCVTSPFLCQIQNSAGKHHSIGLQ